MTLAHETWSAGLAVELRNLVLLLQDAQFTATLACIARHRHTAQHRAGCNVMQLEITGVWAGGAVRIAHWALPSQVESRIEVPGGD